jgi:hypothetical protein
MLTAKKTVIVTCTNMHVLRHPLRYSVPERQECPALGKEEQFLPEIPTTSMMRLLVLHPFVISIFEIAGFLSLGGGAFGWISMVNSNVQANYIAASRDFLFFLAALQHRRRYKTKSPLHHL